MKKKTKKTKTCWGQGQRQGVAMGGYVQLYINGKLHPEITISSANLFCHEWEYLNRWLQIFFVLFFKSNKGEK